MKSLQTEQSGSGTGEARAGGESASRQTQGTGAPGSDVERSSSHQIRNALNAAKLQLTLLEHELAGVRVSADGAHALAAVKAQIDLIADLLVEVREFQDSAWERATLHREQRSGRE